MLLGEKRHIENKNSKVRDKENEESIKEKREEP